jgi:hypothetical protein
VRFLIPQQELLNQSSPEYTLKLDLQPPTMSLFRIDTRSSALLASTQEIANFSDAVMAVLMLVVASNATNIVCRVGRDLSIECVDDGDGIAHDALAALAAQSDAPSASFSDMQPVPLAHVIAAAQ